MFIKMLKRFIQAALVLIFAGGLGGVVYYEYGNTVYEHCVVEIGTEVYASDFAVSDITDIAFADDEAEINTKSLGNHEIHLRAGINRYTSTLTVEDTTPPTAKVNEVTIDIGEDADAAEFVSDVSDATDTTISFVSEPDFNLVGAQDVSVKISDEGGNETVYDTVLTISPLVEEITIEVGDELPVADDFIVGKYTGKMELVTDFEAIDSAKAGEYTVVFTDGSRKYTSHLNIIDTTPPVLRVQSVKAYFTSELSPYDFIKSIDDVSEVTVEFENTPDMESAEAQDITIVATDSFGNSASETARLTLRDDNEAPRISGVKDMFALLGEGVSYKKGVTVTDNCDKDIQLEVDEGGANTGSVGKYTITYSATDKAGNTTTKTATLTVGEIAYDQATVDALADEVLSGIINGGMGSREKLNAIYRWVRGNVRYVNHSDKGDWRKAAVEGLYYHRGDCYVYYATAKALLTRAGIANTDIQKLPGYSSMHYWNLVDIGEGWYHYDTCPRTGGGDFNYLTDEQMMAYSQAHGNSHIYDPSLYPPIQ